ADDLALSGSVSPATAERIVRVITEIVRSEGFDLNPAKTRAAAQGQRQRLAGVVVNRHPNLARSEYDELRAILHNCAVTGLASQNRDRHPDFERFLAGRVSWAAQLNPHRRAKLEGLLTEATSTQAAADGE
ncbi:MAG: reverse transcriptase family protein, partial [Acidimicrobiales bacterium]